MSLLQGQCPEGGGDFGRVQAVAVAGHRRIGSTQGAAMRDMGLHNQANASASCMVRGAVLCLAWGCGVTQAGVCAGCYKSKACQCRTAQLQLSLGCSAGP